jgi:hypothetical protein
MNTYDQNRPPRFLYPQCVYNFIWTFFPPKGPKEPAMAPDDQIISSSRIQDTIYYMYLAVGYEDSKRQHFKLSRRGIPYDSITDQCRLNDEALFKALREEVYKILRPNLFKHIMFPCQISHVEYWEVRTCFIPGSH